MKWLAAFKGWKTISTNIMMFVAVQFPAVKDFLGVEGMAAVVTLINVILRTVTTTAVGKRK